MAPWFSGKFEGKIESVLILGLGGGVQVKLFNKYYEVNNIVGVEIDPLIIEVGKKYFDLTDKNLQIVNEDAYEFVFKTTEKNDLIIVDVYKENKFDAGTNAEFQTKLNNLLTPNGVLFINKLKSDTNNITLESDLKNIYKCVIKIPIYYNVFFIATNSTLAPNTNKKIRNILFEVSKKYKDLKFMSSLNLK